MTIRYQKTITGDTVVLLNAQKERHLGTFYQYYLTSWAFLLFVLHLAGPLVDDRRGITVASIVRDYFDRPGVLFGHLDAAPLLHKEN